MFPLVRFIVRTGLGVLLRPDLWGTAVRQVRVLAPRRWWASGNRLPIPRSDYLAFRNVTLTGDPGGFATVDDVITYLEWCRSLRSLPARG